MDGEVEGGSFPLDQGDSANRIRDGLLSCVSPSLM